MNRKAWTIMIAVTAVLLLAGTAWMASRHAASALRPQPEGFRQVTDMTGREVRIPARPTRILSLCTSATDTLVGLHAEDRLAAIDEFGRVVPGAEHIAVVGKGSAISREQVVALEVDLAFLWWYQDDAAATLEDLGIPVVRVRSGCAAELPAMIRLVGQCADRRDAAERLAEPVERFLAQSPAGPARNGRRVFIELYGPLKTVGRDTYTNDLLTLAGARNVAADAKGSVVFSAERLVQADPDLILYVGDASERVSLADRLGAAQLRAVREGRVFAVDRYWLVAGPNMPRSVEKVRAIVSGTPTP